ncbi:hypothetical protein [uncultured Desulfovibrio sp.]|uniref:putative antirestriction adenine methyltransferase n=1 Tax=uncultured Desulfovibrio sp. TaxID=167968 RepID=UPI00260F84A2|nr:hypothetical protein [uncultured Desulfovibrio sp.]
MFVGSIPKKVCWQVANRLNLERFRRAYVGCSGSFRLESVIGKYFPVLEIFSNDVSFLSCAIGKAAVGDSFPYKFFGELDFLSRYNGKNPLWAVSACGIALEYSAASPNNEFGKKKRRAVIEQVEHLFQANLDKAQHQISQLRIVQFFQGDFKQQIELAKKNEGIFLCYAPTYRGGYERLYKIINENTVWDSPTYEVWDPKNIANLVMECESSGVPYAIFSDILLKDTPPSFCYNGNGHPVYTYAKAASSLRVEKKKVAPFKYQPVLPDALTKESQVAIVEVSSAQIAFLKSIYLAKGIDFKSGMANFLVLLDGNVAGGITYSQSRYGDRVQSVYLLSDFSIRREKKLAKLVAMIATSQKIISILNKRWLVDMKEVFTSVFTQKAISMKYRGIFKIKNKKNGCINYFSPVRDSSPQEIYQEWWDKYGSKA